MSTKKAQSQNNITHRCVIQSCRPAKLDSRFMFFCPMYGFKIEKNR